MKPIKKTFLFLRQLTKNKGLEIQLTLGKFMFVGRPNWFVVAFETRSKCDHAGVEFRLELLKIFYFHINIYDFRHWNNTTNTYCDHGDVSYS